MNVLIIEDEKPAADKLKRMLTETDPEIHILDQLSSVQSASGWLLSHPDPELIFMDIQLEDGICFEIFDNVEIHTPVIFTTAYDEYSLKAFKVNSVDYLLKPIDQDELNRAVSKFKNIHQNKTGITDIQSLITQLKPKTKERFLIKTGNRFHSVSVTDIACFYIIERCTFIFTHDGRNYPVEFSLDNIESQIDPNRFFRVNRNFILNFSAIREIIAFSSSRLKLTLNTAPVAENILVSRERVAAFKSWMDR
ncbi:LytR/AlgR family response regulator transcription factor [Saccharicrinis sp. FJH54]|uniref:LytR/AlgR family response regulator transcription factor n=1 Tax=Saccharicrinis sp. FJH54 TaxID=3344665 RepID=UPI0035D4B545